MHNVLDIHVHGIHISAMKTLAEHMAENGIKDAPMAELVGCERSMITKIRLQKATPSLPLAIRINKATGVPIESLLAAKAEEATE